MSHQILTERPRLTKPIAAELNFTAERLMALPQPQIQSVFAGLQSDIKSDEFTSAMRCIMNLIMDSHEELTRYMNGVFGNCFDAYLFDSAREKVPLFAWFFFNHLKKEGEEVKIRPINLETLETA